MTVATERATLFVADFDRTVAETFAVPHGGLGVTEAYEQAIEVVFGAEARRKYVDNGGLENRAPLEVVKELIGDANASTDTVQRALLKLNKTKLDILVGQIGMKLHENGDATWPQPTEGYIELLQALQVANRAETTPVQHAILSSGHTVFIEATYAHWQDRFGDLLLPLTVVTTDDTENLSTVFCLSPDQLVKPSKHLMTATINRLLGEETSRRLGDEQRAQTLYVGDDEIKDGELAKNADVDFVLMPHSTEGQRLAWARVAKQLGLSATALSAITSGTNR